MKMGNPYPEHHRSLDDPLYREGGFTKSTLHVSWVGHVPSTQLSLTSDGPDVLQHRLRLLIPVPTSAQDNEVFRP
jgi:hypothetical protein